MTDPSRIHKQSERGFTLCAAEEHPYREYPLYHGPPIHPRFANPYFSGTVIPYAEAADWRGPGGPQPL